MPEKNTLLRQWQMLKLVPRRGRKPASVIHQQLEESGYKVGLRTVQRDLKEICEENIFPLRQDESKPIGWHWDRDADIFDIPGRDPYAALTLRMADDYLRQVLPKSCVDLLQPQAQSAQCVLDNLDLDHYRNWPGKIRTISRAQPLEPPEIKPSVLESVYEALLHGYRLKGMYRGVGKEEAEERVINPQGLIIADPIIYLLGTFGESQKVYHMALHRFESAAATTELAKSLVDFDIDAYIASGAFGFPKADQKRIDLKVRFYEYAGDHLTESPLCPDQKSYREDDDLIIEANVPNTCQLRWWLASFGEYVEILEPISLRQSFAEMAENMLEMYQED